MANQLSNGYTPTREKYNGKGEGIVLVKKDTMWVTWFINELGDASEGHWFSVDEETKANDDFDKRVEGFRF